MNYAEYDHEDMHSYGSMATNEDAVYTAVEGGSAQQKANSWQGNEFNAALFASSLSCLGGIAMTGATMGVAAPLTIPTVMAPCSKMLAATFAATLNFMGGDPSGTIAKACRNTPEHDTASALAKPLRDPVTRAIPLAGTAIHAPRLFHA